ncbi:MAG TPA: hypothetical protein ENJ09_06515 [Planctomycetes bacterium]|nr:hypothetical protein [Planctomycetota bacterium]
MRRSILLTFAALPLLALPSPAQEDVPSFQEANAALQAGNFEEAAELFHERALADPNDGQAHFLYAYSLHAAGDLDAAHDAHIDAARFPRFTSTALYNHACVHALRGEHDAAFQALDEAIDAGFNNADQLENDADFAPVRGDGRFESVLLRLRGIDPTDLAKLPASRLFDFYVGDWSMWNGDNVEHLLSVSSTLDGHGLTASAKDAKTGASVATSTFVYAPEQGVWRQVWVSRDGMVVTLEGGLADGAIVLEQTTQNGARETGARSIFSEIRPDGFRYEWQTSEDGGKTWKTVATRTFTRS